MSDFKLFDNDTHGSNPNDVSLIERRFEGQWIYTVAFREALSIAFRRPVTYPEVFAATDKYAHEILGRQDLLFRPGESKSARYYRERAALLTARLQRETGSTEKNIRPIEALDREIRELRIYSNQTVAKTERNETNWRSFVISAENLKNKKVPAVTNRKFFCMIGIEG